MNKGLIEKKNDLLTRAESMVDAAEKENRELTPDEAAELAEIRDMVRKIMEQLKLENEIKEMADMEIKPKEEETEMNQEQEQRSIEIREEQQFENFIRGWAVHERSGELANASGSGAAVVPTTIAKRIVKKVYDLCPVLARSQRYNIRGKLDLPVYGDTSGNDHITAAYAADFTAPSSHSGAFSTVTLTGFLIGALTKIGNSLINNVQFDVVGFVVDEMAATMARFIEGELLHGTSSPAQKIYGLSAATNTLTAAAQAAVTADEIVKLHDKVKDVYQGNAIWIMSPATRTALRLLKGNDGHYLLNDDLSAPWGQTLLGKPVYVSDNMPDMAHSARSIIYGDMTGLATNFVEDVNVQILRERYADEHATGVVAFAEVDANVVDNQKIAVLVQA